MLLQNKTQRLCSSIFLLSICDSGTSDPLIWEENTSHRSIPLERAPPNLVSPSLESGCHWKTLYLHYVHRVHKIWAVGKETRTGHRTKNFCFWGETCGRCFDSTWLWGDSIWGSFEEATLFFQGSGNTPSSQSLGVFLSKSDLPWRVRWMETKKNLGFFKTENVWKFLESWFTNC